MSRLIKLLAEYVTDELTQAVNSAPKNALRMMFSAPPRKHLSQLYQHLSNDGNGLVLRTLDGEITIPVYLLDPDSKDPEGWSITARCSQAYLVTMRNYKFTKWIALQEVGASTVASLVTAVKPIGIPKEESNFDIWLQTPVIQFLIKRYLEFFETENVRKKAKTVIEFTLRNSWEAGENSKDKEILWNIIEKLINSNVNKLNNYQSLLANLGLSNSELATFGLDNHLKTNKIIADFFDIKGIRGGFAELINSSDQDLLPYIREFQRHIMKQGVLEASEFLRNSHVYYSPIENDSDEIPEWWIVLTDKKWALLLDFESPIEQEGLIQCHLRNTLTASPRGIFPVTKETVELDLSMTEFADPTEVTIERSIGNAKLVEIERKLLQPESNFLFVDNEIPNHERFIRYKISSENHLPITIKVVVLDYYNPSIIAINAGAKKSKHFSLNRKAKIKETGKTVERYEAEITLSGMGSHHLSLWTSNGIKLSPTIIGHDVDAENTVLERHISQNNENLSSCLIDTDEECYYDFEAYSSENNSKIFYRIYITAEESVQTGAASEFERLIMTHRASANKDNVSPRVDPINCRASDIEMWILEDELSFNPLILGPDYILNWKKPDWSSSPKISDLSLFIDPRPSQGSLNPPKDFLESRKAIFEIFKSTSDEQTPRAASLLLHDFINDENNAHTLIKFLTSYLEWLEQDYESAVWCDVVSIHAAQSNNRSLEATPYTILLSPYHPIRLAWQCYAQSVLQNALDGNARCPAASVISATSFPDCLSLPCNTATGRIEFKSFTSMVSTSDYWSVLLAVDSNYLDVAAEGMGIFGDDFGINIDGLSRGFSAQQVVRSLEDVSKLTSGKSTLKISISSSSLRSSSCNNGIDDWCSANLGLEGDAWHEAGQRSLIVNDLRDQKLQPEQSVLSSLTTRTDGAVRWYGNRQLSSGYKTDLSIIAHLSTVNHSFGIQGIRSAIDTSALTRWRVRKQLPSQNSAFIAESRIGELPNFKDGDSLNGLLLRCVDLIERQCKEMFDSYIFAPDMDELTEVVDRSRYTALSSSNIDAACFFGTTDKAYLWDYELPSYAKRAGENSGYYLLAKESQGMLHAVNVALDLLGKNHNLSPQHISSLLEEVSRRGMPTLKRLTAGGSMSLGEIGMLVGFRILQSEFEINNTSPAVIPVMGQDKTLNLIISADPFQKQFDDLRRATDHSFGDRPDLLVLSIYLEDNTPIKLKITPIEIKARSDSMSTNKRVGALEQATRFAGLLTVIRDKSHEFELWGIAWRNLLATVIDYAFRIYGQLDQFMAQAEWAKHHSAILKTISNGSLTTEIDFKGRLLVIDSSDSSSWQDLDNDGFNETLRLSHREAMSVLCRDDPEFISKVIDSVGDWGLKPSIFNDEPTDINKPIVEVEPDSNNEATIDDEAHNKLNHTGAVNDGSKPSGIRFSIGETLRQFSSEKLDFFPGNTALTQLNVGIVGDLGTGKTQLIQSLVRQLGTEPAMNRGKAPNVLIFDYKRDYSKPEFVKATGAKVISPHNIPLNLFDTSDSEQGERAWLGRSKFFCDILDKLYGGLGDPQKHKIKTAIKEAYSIAKESNRSAPTMNDVFEQYASNNEKIDTPYSIMSDLIDGEHFVSDNSDVVPFSEFLDGVVVIDLASIGQDDRTKNMLVVIFLNLFYEHMLKIEKREFLGKDPQLRFVDSYLLVDEADNIMRHEFEVLDKILLQGREFGVGVLLASQYLSHFKTKNKNYLEPLKTWFIHQVPNIKVSDLEGIGLTGVNQDILDTIRRLQCHECLYKTLDINGKLMRGIPFFELPK